MEFASTFHVSLCHVVSVLSSRVRAVEYGELAGLFFLQSVAAGSWLVPLTSVLAAHGLAALRAYTTAPARATGESKLRGALAPGYLADIVVLSENVLRVRPNRLFKPQVEMVIVGGRVRHRRTATR